MAKLLIIGTGAMAQLFGSRLAAAGIQVTLLGTWKDGIAAIEQNGIRVLGSEGENSFPAAAAGGVEEIQKARAVLILVKSWQTARAAEQLTHILHPDGIGLTLQNGLGNLEILASVLGKERVAQGVTTYGSTLLGPGLIRPGGEGQVNVPRDPRLVLINNMLKQAGFSLQESPDITSLIWSKLVINVAINPLTALMGVKNGKMLESESARSIMRQAANEAAQVARRKGIKLSFKDPVQAVESVARTTSDNFSSMFQDIRRGAPTEIDFLCGAVSRLGKSLNIPVPVNHLLWQLIKARVDYFGNDDYENSN